MSNAAFNLHNTHHHEPIPGQGDQVRLTGVFPYLRLARGTGTLYAKDGQVVGADGLPVASVPEWFWEEARKATPAVRAEVRLRLPEEEPLASVTPAPVAPKPASHVLAGPLVYRCPEPGCGRELLPKQKTFHALAHRRAALKAVQVVGAI